MGRWIKKIENKSELLPPQTPQTPLGGLGAVVDEAYPKNSETDGAEPSISREPKPKPANFVEDGISYVAQCHSNPLWVKSRNNWKTHYYQCDVCKRFHRSTKYKPDENPCSQGKALYQAYEEQWLVKPT